MKIIVGILLISLVVVSGCARYIQPSDELQAELDIDSDNMRNKGIIGMNCTELQHYKTYRCALLENFYGDENCSPEMVEVMKAKNCFKGE
ncbi:hypothetical protein HQ529_03510 [Candidatus Woesearchaeota archaeon]|nr:hypothetical protein [Candidatus Woesearchaeota archaeon]